MKTTTPTRSPLGRTPAPLPDCRHCGFRTHLISQDAIADALREYATAWQRVLRDPRLSGRRAGVPAWSALECGCHVRDMCLLFHTRLDAILGQSPNAPSARAAVTSGAAADRPDSAPALPGRGAPARGGGNWGGPPRPWPAAWPGSPPTTGTATTRAWPIRGSPSTSSPATSCTTSPTTSAEAVHDDGADAAHAENGAATHLRMRGFHG